MLYNFLFLHQNFIKVISIESWGHKDYIKLIPVLGNSLYLVSLAVLTFTIELTKKPVAMFPFQSFTVLEQLAPKLCQEEKGMIFQ